MTTGRPRRDLRPGLLAVGLTCAVAFVVLAAVATRGQPTRVDRAVAGLLGASSTGSASFRVADVVSMGGSPAFVVLAAVALALLVWTRRRDVVLAAWCVAAPAAAGLLQLAAKGVVNPRHPVWFDPSFADRMLAFPSGHATGAASVATIVVVLALTSVLPRSSCRALVATAAVFALAVAGSRVVLDYHLAVDAIGGLLLGVAVTTLGAVVALGPARVVEPRPARRPIS